MPILRASVVVLFAWLVTAVAVAADPIALCPENPRYFLFRGSPTALVGSGEHYGAVLNPAFDYVRYLETLKRDGLNVTRLFVGTYLERSGDFGIALNNLAPAPGTALLPWARSAAPGFILGGNKFDLSRWDERYFVRLRDFIRSADAAGIVVEVTLFSAYYGNRYSPLFAGNNVNGVGDVPPSSMNTLENGGALPFQEAVVRRIVRELNAYDNVYFEIQNEPWASDQLTVRILNPYLEKSELKQEGQFWKNRVDVASPASLAWQRRVAAWVTDEEGRLPRRHLLSQNYTNFYHALDAVDPSVSVLNFHYTSPEAVRLNEGLARVVAFNETGFAGAADTTYRKQAWHFMLAGGGAFNHLDYSFAVGHEDGTAANTAPGGGSAALRRQLGVLRGVLASDHLASAHPDHDVVVHASGAVTRALSDGRGWFVIYFDGQGPSSVTLRLADARYRAEWLDTRSGAVVRAGDVRVDAGRAALTSPAFDDDLLLRIVRQ